MHDSRKHFLLILANMEGFTQAALDHFKTIRGFYGKSSKTNIAFIRRLSVLGFILSAQLEMIPDLPPWYIGTDKQSFLSVENDSVIYEIQEKFKAEHEKVRVHQFRFWLKSPASYYDTVVKAQQNESTDTCVELIFNGLKVDTTNFCNLTKMSTQKIELTELKYDTHFLRQCFNQNDLTCISMEVTSLMTILMTYIQHIATTFVKNLTNDRLDIILDGILHYWHKFSIDGQVLILKTRDRSCYVISKIPHIDSIETSVFYLVIRFQKVANKIADLRCTGSTGIQTKLIGFNAAIIEIEHEGRNKGQFSIFSRLDICWRTWSQILRVVFKDGSGVSAALLAYEMLFFLHIFKQHISTDFLAFSIGQIMTCSSESRLDLLFDRAFNKISFASTPNDDKRCTVFEIYFKNHHIIEGQKISNNPSTTSSCTLISIDIDLCQNNIDQCIVKTASIRKIDIQSHTLSFQAVKFPGVSSRANLSAYIETFLEVYCHENEVLKLIISPDGLVKTLRQSLIGTMGIKVQEEHEKFFVVEDQNSETTVVYFPAQHNWHQSIETLLQEEYRFLLDNEFTLVDFSFLSLLKGSNPKTENAVLTECKIQNTNYTRLLCDTQCEKRLQISCSDDLKSCNVTLKDLKYFLVDMKDDELESSKMSRIKYAEIGTKPHFADRMLFESELSYYTFNKSDAGNRDVLVAADHDQKFTERFMSMYIYHLLLQVRHSLITVDGTFFTKVSFHDFDSTSVKNVQYLMDKIYTLSIHGCIENAVTNTHTGVSVETSQAMLFDGNMKLPSYKIPQLYRFHNAKNYKTVFWRNRTKLSYVLAHQNNLDALFVEGNKYETSSSLRFTIGSDFTEIVPEHDLSKDLVVIHGRFRIISGQSDASDLITFSCQVFSIDGRGGSPASGRHDFIFVPRRQLCRKVHSIFVSNFTYVVNEATSGIFWYIVKNHTTNSASIHIKNGKRTRHVVLLPCNLADLVEFRTKPFDDQTMLVIACAGKSQSSSLKVAFDTHYDNIVLNFQDHFHVNIAPKDTLTIFFKRHAENDGDQNRQSDPNKLSSKLRKIARKFGKPIIYRDESIKHVTMITHNGEQAPITEFCTRNTPSILLTIVRIHPEYTAFVTINGQYTSIDFGQLIPNDQDRFIDVILVNNQVENLVYLNLKELCWLLKDRSDELEIRLSNKNLLYVDLYLANSSRKIGSIKLMGENREVQILVSLEFTMRIILKNGHATLKPSPCLVPVATSQVLLHPESCYREIWLVFENRHIMSLDQFKFDDTLVLLATSANETQLVAICLYHYFSETGYFRLLTFESQGRTWRMRRLD